MNAEQVRSLNLYDNIAQTCKIVTGAMKQKVRLQISKIYEFVVY